MPPRARDAGKFLPEIPKGKDTIENDLPESRVVKVKEFRKGCQSVRQGREDGPQKSVSPRLNSNLNDAERTIPFCPMMANLKMPTNYIDRMIKNMWSLYDKKNDSPKKASPVRTASSPKQNIKPTI